MFEKEVLEPSLRPMKERFFKLKPISPATAAARILNWGTHYLCVCFLLRNFRPTPLGFRDRVLSTPRPRQASKAFATFHQHKKRKDCNDQTSRCMRLVVGSFFAPETDMIFGDGVGISIVFVV